MHQSSALAKCRTGGSALLATHIDLGLSVDVLDVGPFRATAREGAIAGYDEAFL